MSKELIEDERQRIESQRLVLGEDGLKILGAQLDHANRMNEAQIPSRIMEGFPIPSVSSISSIEVLTAINPYYQHTINTIPRNLVQAHVNRDGHMKDIPYFIQYDRKVLNVSYHSFFGTKKHFPCRYFICFCINICLYEYSINAFSS
jgi:hypothetical protein